MCECVTVCGLVRVVCLLCGGVFFCLCLSVFCLFFLMLRGRLCFFLLYSSASFDFYTRHVFFFVCVFVSSFAVGELI